MDRFATRTAVYIILKKDDKFLMFRRKNTGWYDGFYNLPCGHIDGRETLIEAAIRETKEEVGVDIKEKNLQFVHLVHRRSDGNDGYFEYTEAYFAVDKWSGKPQITEVEHGEALEWFDINELPKNTLPYTREALINIKNKSLYSQAGWKKNFKISLIAAIGKNRELGKNNQLLWNLPEDLKHFKEKTLGQSCIMGQRTFDSIGKPLPGRLNVVLSQDPKFKPKGVVVCNSIEQALARASNYCDEVFIIGGASIYAQFIDRADKLYLTLVDSDFDADVYFPEYNKFKMIKDGKQQISNELKFKFTEWERKK